MTKIQLAIGIAALMTIGALVTLVWWRGEQHVVRGGFWFEDVTFDLPVAAVAGGPITEPERKTIESLAWAELRQAYADFRIVFVDSPDVRYSIRVVQRPPPTRLSGFAVGESYSMGVLGGMGTINFEALASIAMGNAPPGAARATIIEGIGRGIGRAAAHEFAHQLLTGLNIHATTDASSYEYRSMGVAQFYGPIHWDVARPFLLDRLGPHESVR